MAINTFSSKTSTTQKGLFTYKFESSAKVGRFSDTYYANIFGKGLITSTTKIWESYKAMEPVKMLDEDLELAAYNAEEIHTLAIEAAGVWADRDDITDDWLDELRKGWNINLDDFTSTNSNNLPI